MSGNDPLAAILDWFLEIEQWLPGAHSTVGEIVYGIIPKSDATMVYDLADAWGQLAEELNQAYEEIADAGNQVIESWVGDGGAAAFREHWTAYLRALSTTAQGAAEMRQGVRQFGVQVELMKFMTALNLLMLAYTLLALIMAALYSFGISLGGAVPAFMSFQGAVSAAASKVLGAIANIGIRIGIRPLTFVLGRAVPTVVRTGVAAGTRAVVPRVAGMVVPSVVRTTVGGFARRAATRGISRSVSSRLAGQALRGAAGRRMRMELAGEVAEGAARYAAGRGAGRLGSWAAGRGAAASARHLAARGTLAVRSALAREIQAQMLARAAGRTVVHTTESLAIRQMAAAQAMRIGLGRELAEYVGIRVAFGAGFLGGGNLLGQVVQMAEGNRVSLDTQQVVQGTVQGAAFAIGMWGGVVGHTAGGAVAGGLVAAAYEAYDYFTADADDPRKAFDLHQVGHHALQGAVMGVVAGADVQISTTRFSGGLKIGDSVHAVAADGGGLAVVAAAGDGRVIAVGDAGFAYQHPLGDGAVQRTATEGMARDAGVAEVFRALMPDAGGGPPPSGPTPARALDGPAPTRAPQLPAAPDVPLRDPLPARPGDGGGGGGPRPPASQAPAGPGGVRGPAVDGGGAAPGRAPVDPAPRGPVIEGTVVERSPSTVDPAASPGAGPVVPRDGGLVPAPDGGPVPSPDAGAVPSRDGGLVPSRDAGLVAPRDAGLVAPRDAGSVSPLDGAGPGPPPDTSPAAPRDAAVAPREGGAAPPDGPVTSPDGAVPYKLAHAPADPAARADLVQRELANAWSTLHSELHGVPGLRPPGDGPPPQDLSLAALEEPAPGVPVIGPERLTFLDATPATPAEPPPLTPEAVGRMLADPALPEPVAGWVRDNLAVRGADGAYLPRSAEEIASTIARLQAEATRAVDITASRIEDSQFHGYGRAEPDPSTVLGAAREALDGSVGRLPADAPLRGLRLDLTTVPADSLPGGAVARSVPVHPEGYDLPPGTVPPEGGGYRVEVSDRATDPAVARGMAHEVNELSAALSRAADGLELSPPDVLRPGEHADGSRLSPHDLGRLGEVEVLAGLLGDTRYGGYAHAELGALRDHLGLTPDQPGAAGRRGLVEPHLSPEARAALDNLGPPGDGPHPYRLSGAENERIFRDEIVPNHLTGATPQQRPVVVFVGGQTGAGKTAITDMIKNALAARGDYININMDYYNPHHPAFDRLQAADETTASANVRPDGDLWWDKAQDHAIGNRNDVVLETAMRTPAEFETIAAKFRAAGYRVEVAIVAVPEASSRLGVLDRFWSEFKQDGHGRYVERESHDATYDGVIRAARELDTAHLADGVFVFRRGGEVLYSNHLTPDGQWAQPPATVEAVRAERTRTWTATEEQWFLNTVERLRGEIGHQWRAEVDEIAELGRPLSPTMRAEAAPRPALVAGADGGPPPRPEGVTPDPSPTPAGEVPPPGDPTPVPADPTPPPADPAPLPADPAPPPADPAPPPADPAPRPGDPAPLPGDPAALPGDPAAGDVVSALRGEAAGDHLPFDRADLDPNPRPGETPEQVAERVEWAQTARVYNDLGPEPPRIDMIENDAAHAADGAHSLGRHGWDIPLERDPSRQTIEGRIYGDTGWPGAQNYSYRWLDPTTMHRSVNDYVSANWEAIRGDLAQEGVHTRVVKVGDFAIGEGYHNRTVYQQGPPSARYDRTSLMEIRIELVPGSDPAKLFVVTAFPNGRGF